MVLLVLEFIPVIVLVLGCSIKFLIHVCYGQDVGAENSIEEDLNWNRLVVIVDPKLEQPRNSDDQNNATTSTKFHG